MELATFLAPTHWKGWTSSSWKHMTTLQKVAPRKIPVSTTAIRYVQLCAFKARPGSECNFELLFENAQKCWLYFRVGRFYAVRRIGLVLPLTFMQGCVIDKLAKCIDFQSVQHSESFGESSQWSRSPYMIKSCFFQWKRSANSSCYMSEKQTQLCFIPGIPYGWLNIILLSSEQLLPTNTIVVDHSSPACSRGVLAKSEHLKLIKNN